MTYEYRFVQLKRGWFTTDIQRDEYQRIVREHAVEGWRLVQIFAPGDAFGPSRHYDLIFERPVT